MPQSHSDQFLPLFPIFFAGMWVLVCFVISHMGWRSFSARHAMRTRPAGRAYSSPSSWFGNLFASYRNVVQVVFTDAGIYFYPMFLFRAFHPPFLVPWASVRRVEKKDGFFGQRYRLDIEDVAGEIHVLLPASIEEDLLKHRQTT